MVSPESRPYIEIPPTARKFNFHVANYFLVRKPVDEETEVLGAHGLNPYVYDPVMTPLEVKRLLWDQGVTDAEGFFTFYPSRMVLGHTAESIIIPLNRTLRMRDRFVSKETGQEIPLTTNLGAPLLHAGSRGPQTYEIINESRTPLRIKVADLMCLADVFQLTGEVLPRDGASSFGEQKVGEISVGGSDDEVIKAIRRAIIARKALES